MPVPRGEPDEPGVSTTRHHAADVTLSFGVLDAIDEIVAPGVTVNPVDNSYGDFELRADQRRR